MSILLTPVGLKKKNQDQNLFYKDILEKSHGKKRFTGPQNSL